MSGPSSEETPDPQRVDAEANGSAGSPSTAATVGPTGAAAVGRSAAAWLRKVDPLVGGAVLLAVLCLTGGLLHAVLTAPGGGADAAPAAPATTKPAEEPAPSPEPTAPPEPTQTVVNGHPLPMDCAGLYTRDWTPDMQGLVLNPAWADPATFPASGDEGIAGLATGSADLQCLWAPPEAADGRSVLTTVAVPSGPQQEAALAQMAAVGYSCWEEYSGTRCTAEWQGDEGLNGDSHFFRDGVWFATRWVGVAPDGYTHDLIQAVFGG